MWKSKCRYVAWKLSTVKALWCSCYGNYDRNRRVSAMGMKCIELLFRNWERFYSYDWQVKWVTAFRCVCAFVRFRLDFFVLFYCACVFVCACVDAFVCVCVVVNVLVCVEACARMTHSSTLKVQHHGWGHRAHHYDGRRVWVGLHCTHWPCARADKLRQRQ